MSFEPFQIGRFFCVHELSLGSTTGVYVARSQGVEGFEKLVVLKRVHAHVAEDPEFVRRFVAEARLGAALSHAGIVRVLECAAEGGTYYMASEHVDGISVRQLLTSLDRRGRRLPPESAAAIAMGVADALDYAHRFTGLAGEGAGVIHGGLRPSKVLLARSRGVKVLDFGVAAAFAYARRSAPSTDWGDYAYLAPEVVQEGRLSPASDLFALGAILYELSTCEPLFLRADPGSTLQAVQQARVPRHPALPDPLYDLIQWCVAADPGARASGAADVHDTLAEWLASRRLTPSAAMTQADLGDLFSDWAVRLTATPPPSQEPQTRELAARRRAATEPRGQRAWDPAEGTLDPDEPLGEEGDPWDPLFALEDALGRGPTSHVTGLSAVVDAADGRPTRPLLPPVTDEDEETVERRFARSPASGPVPSPDWLEGGTATSDPPVDLDGEWSGAGSWPTGPGPEVWPAEPSPSEAPPAPPAPAASRPAAGSARLAELAADLEALLVQRPTDPAVRNHLAGVYRLQGRFEEAEGALGTVLADAPGFAPAWYQLGLLRQQTEQPEEAEWAFQQALSADPALQDARLALAALRLSTGALEAAITELTAVVAANWQSGRAHRLLAHCFLRSGEREAALEHCDYAASFGEEVAQLRREILGGRFGPPGA